MGRWVEFFGGVTDFAGREVFQGGLPPDRIVGKPNFAPDRGVERVDGDYALFVGRLSPERGGSRFLRPASGSESESACGSSGTGPKPRR